MSFHIRIVDCLNELDDKQVGPVAIDTLINELDQRFEFTDLDVVDDYLASNSITEFSDRF